MSVTGFRPSGRSGGAFVCALLVLLAVPGAALAQIDGSLHDFSDKPQLAPGGTCSACHRTHYAPEGTALWVRDLSQERAEFEIDTDPDYVPGGTLSCYDCHVDYVTSGSGATPDNDPADTIWTSGYEPQDVAFTDGPESPPATSATGYYELIDGTVPRDATNPPPTPPLFPPVTEATGGHFWKGSNGDTPNAPYSLGDKLACEICHDPHDKASGSGVQKNEVMLRNQVIEGATVPITVGYGLKASSASRDPDLGSGREMCAGCHNYSGAASPKVLYGVRIPIPPAKSFDGHASDDSTECTLCHPHASPDCGGCHGNPPPEPAAGYGGIDETLGPHPRHANDFFDHADPKYDPLLQGYGFDCTFCHATFPTDHRNGDYQNVSFNTTKNPTGSYTAGTRTCSSLYCHSRGTGPADTLNRGGTDTVAWTAANWNANDLGCEACHGADGAPRAANVVEYGAPGYANGTPKANSHAKHRYACATCHYDVVRDYAPADGWTLHDESLHASNNEGAAFVYDVDPDAATPRFASYTPPATIGDGGTCANIVCHGGNSAQWGQSLTCTDCHLNTAGGDADNWNIGDDTISLVGQAEWTTTGHGLASGWFPWPQNYTTSKDGSPIDAPALTCVSSDPARPVGGCHSGDVPHGLLQNPFRLTTADTTNRFFFEPGSTTVIDRDSLNKFCWECHDVNREQTHSQAQTTGNNWGNPPSAAVHFKCIDCHDPHGDANDYMIQAAVFADSSRNDAYTDYGLPELVDGLGVQGPIAFTVTEPTQEQSDYVNLAVADTTKLCMTCHQSNLYFTRSSTVANHNSGVDCIQCHPHNKGIQPLCELCHSADPNNIYLGTAPNVMGDCTTFLGVGSTPKPYDCGTWGYNVNGHGANGTAPNTQSLYPGAKLPNRSCTPNPLVPSDTGCHDISNPPGQHLNGVVDTMLPGGNVNANTSHLIVGDFLPSTASDHSVTQKFFDDRCFKAATGCHPGNVVSGVPSIGHRHESSHGDGIMRFGDHGTTADPKQDRAPDPFWIPWTIRDHTNTFTGTDARTYGTCASCHDPHGTTTPAKSIWTPSGPASGSNHMIRHNWFANPTFFCASQCHRVP